MARDDTPVITHLIDEDGADEYGRPRRTCYNNDMEDGPNIGIGLFGDALSCWIVCQNNEITINEAALSFNVRPELIVQAVEYHPYMFIDGDKIGLDGE